MKVKVISEFKDKYTETLHKIGDELEMPAERINEILKVGRFIEVMEQTEQTEPSEPEQQEAADSESVEEIEEVEEQVAETTSKQAARRKRK